MDFIVIALIWFLNVMRALLFARVILSWFPMARGNRLVGFLFAFTEPLLSPIRRLIQRSPLGGPGMMLDFSVLIAFVLITLAHNVLFGML